MFKVPEKFRVKTGIYASDETFGTNGQFIVISLKLPRPLRIIASDGGGWEHVSVSLQDRCPSWDEMNFTKDLFWDEDDCVVQFHPPRADYINNHPYCLHLWRPIGIELPKPWHRLVGIKD